MASFHETPQAWWDDEPVFETAAKTSIAAAAEDEAAAPEQGISKKTSKRGSILETLLLSSKGPTEEQPKDLILIHTGWVSKQGHFVANWKKRFLRLVIDNRSLPRTATLAYYKSADLGEDSTRVGEQGSLPLAAATIESCDEAAASATAPKSWGFKVTTSAGKVYPFRAESAADREEWLLKLQEAAASCKLVQNDRRGSAVMDIQEVAAADAHESSEPPPSWLSDMG